MLTAKAAPTSIRVYPIEQVENLPELRQSGSVSDAIGQKRRRVLEKSRHKGQVVG